MNEKNIKYIPHNCLIKIRSVYGTIKSAERKAVDYILEHPKEIGNLTIVDFAQKSGCSEATVVRLAKRLGYEGYLDLRADFAEDTGTDGIADYGGIRRTDKSATIVKKVFDASINALRDTFNVMDEKEYERAVNTLFSAKKILLCGVGDATCVALEAYHRFIRVGENCQVSDDPDLQLIMSAHLNENDVLIAISHSGRSKTVLDVVKKAREAKATVIAITNFPVSPIAKNADIVLLTAAFSQHQTGEVISKRITELCIIESLYISFIMKKGEPALKRLKQSNEAVRVHKL
ncbi:MAG: MurR/RpiR family transcriptional regulator [Spirochaetota bacterium]